MVRCIVAASVLFVVAAFAQAERFAFSISNQAELDTFLAFDGAGPTDQIAVIAYGGMWGMTGSWEDDTAELRGRFWLPGNDKLLLPGEVAIPLSNDVGWQVEAQFIAGVTRGGDWGEDWCHTCGPERDLYINDVDLRELNEVRNGMGSADRMVNGRMRYPLGDLAYSGRVDIDDLNLVRNNFGNRGEPIYWTPAAAAVVPEPTSLGLLLIGLFVTALRRARSRRRFQ